MKLDVLDVTELEQKGRTLYDMVSVSADTTFGKVVNTIASASELFRYLPFVDINAGATTIGSNIEVLRIAGGDVEVDKYLIKTRGSEVIDVHRKMKFKAIGLNVADKFINGSSEKDPREFDGLAARIPANGKVKYDSTKPMHEQLAALARTVPGCALIMSKGNSRFLADALMSLQPDKHWYDQRAREFHFPLKADKEEMTKASVIRMDYNDLGKEIMDASCIYAVRFGDKDVMAIQHSPMDIIDFGDVADKPVNRLRIEWYLGLAVDQDDALRVLTNRA